MKLDHELGYAGTMKTNLEQVTQGIIHALQMSADLEGIDATDMAPKTVDTPTGQVARFTMVRYHEDRNKPNLQVEYTVEVRARVVDLDKEG